jgi:hypothetical protein
MRGNIPLYSWAIRSGMQSGSMTLHVVDEVLPLPLPDFYISQVKRTTAFNQVTFLTLFSRYYNPVLVVGGFSLVILEFVLSSFIPQRFTLLRECHVQVPTIPSITNP